MNFAPSEFRALPVPPDCLRPALTFLLAVAGARQSRSPRFECSARARPAGRTSQPLMRCAGCSVAGAAMEHNDLRVVRFLDLSDVSNGSPETMNTAFTRGFQPMLTSDLGTIVGSLPRRRNHGMIMMRTRKSARRRSSAPEPLTLDRCRRRRRRAGRAPQGQVVAAVNGLLSVDGRASGTA